MYNENHNNVYDDNNNNISISDTQTLCNIKSGVMAQSGIIHALWHDFFMMQ